MAATALAIAPLAMGCSLGQGDGAVHSDQLQVDGCWCNGFDLRPDFFAAVPYRNTLQIRVQRGTDLQEVSDGIALLVDDIESIRSSFLNKKLKVELPIGIELTGGDPAAEDELQIGCGAETAEICPKESMDCLKPLETPDKPADDAPKVHMALYLQQSCHNQNSVLYALDGTVIFKELFNGLPNEKQAVNKYTEAIFDVQMVNLQALGPGTDLATLPPEDLTRLQGWFHFYFERGQPGQPFP